MFSTIAISLTGQLIYEKPALISFMIAKTNQKFTGYLRLYLNGQSPRLVDKKWLVIEALKLEIRLKTSNFYLRFLQIRSMNNTELNMMILNHHP